jgi:hypothetical protein
MYCEVNVWKGISVTYKALSYLGTKYENQLQVCRSLCISFKKNSNIGNNYATFFDVE